MKVLSDDIALRDPFAGPWFSSKVAAAYVPCKTVRAWYQWRDRHGIIARANGTVAKADLDRVLKTVTPTRRGTNPNSLANLRKSRRRMATAVLPAREAIA